MSDHHDDFDPETESILEFASRKVRESQERQTTQVVSGVRTPFMTEAPASLRESGVASSFLQLMQSELDRLVDEAKTPGEVMLRTQQMRLMGDWLYCVASRLETQAGIFPESPEWH